MHEDSFASDVSDFPRPRSRRTRKVGYFHVLEKGKRLSGMAPLFTFLDDRDGRDDFVRPRRGHAPRRSTSRPPPPRSHRLGRHSRARLQDPPRRRRQGPALRSSVTHLGRRLLVPRRHGTRLRPWAPTTPSFASRLRDRTRRSRDEMVYLNLGVAVAEGHHRPKRSSTRSPGTTSSPPSCPTADGRVWFTSKFGVVGVIDLAWARRPRTAARPIYAAAIQLFAVRAEDSASSSAPLPDGADEFFDDANRAHEEQDHRTSSPSSAPAFGTLFPRQVSTSPSRSRTRSPCGPDGVYVVSNMRPSTSCASTTETKRDRARPRAGRPTYAEGRPRLRQRSPDQARDTSTTGAARRRPSWGIGSSPSSTTARSRSTSTCSVRRTGPW